MKEKAIATLCTVLTLLGTVSPALAAYDLGDYPDFLFDDHNLNAFVVAGSGGRQDDVVGMTDVAVRLAGESYEEVSAAGVGVTGGKLEEMPLGTQLNDAGYFGITLDDNDIPGLLDAEVSFTTSEGTEEYDIHEEIQLSDDISVETGLTTSNQDEEFKDRAFMEVKKDAIKYCYVFDDNLDPGYFLNDTSSDYPLELEFLGDSLTIVDADTDSIKAQIGDKQLLKAGESLTVAGSTVTLESTTSGNKAVISCGGTTKAVSEGSSAVICGLEVVVDTVIDDEGIENDQAIIIVGEDAEKWYDSGDEYIGEDEDDPDWVWELSNLDTNSPNICVSFDQLWDEADEVPYMEEKVCLPGDYACVELNSFVETDYQDYEVELTTEELYEADGTTTRVATGYVLHWESKGGDDDGFLVGAEDTDDIALYYNSTTKDIEIYYKDPDDNKYKYAGSSLDVLNGTSSGNKFFFTFEDSSVPMYFEWNGAGTSGNMTFNTTGPIKILIELSGNNRFDYLGGGDGDTDTDHDLYYGVTPIAGWEEDTMTATGIKIYDPDAQLSGDSFDFSLNGDESDFTVNVIVTGPGGVTEATGDVIKKVVPVTNAVAKLDTEVSLPVNKHLVLVGGPGVNSLTAQAMGYSYPTYGSQMTGQEFGQGEGFIMVYEDVLETGYVAVVVAGWEATDTRNACSVMQKYAQFSDELDGNVAVKVTSVTSAGITPA